MDRNNNRALRWHLLALALALGSEARQCSAFFVAPQSRVPSTSSCSKSSSTTTTTQLYHWANRLDDRFCDDDSSDQRSILADDDDDDTSSSSSSISHQRPKLQPLSQQFTRRSILSTAITSTALTTLLSTPLVANANNFAPGGTLLDRQVSIFFGNSQASPSRARDNSNVLFHQDNYYKFGAAAPWIDAGSTDFPAKMPFVLSQQRYDALKKYGGRVAAALETITHIGDAPENISASNDDDVPDKTDPVYQLRALGLLANSFLASENTGTTNELMLARWYINEMYLRIGDYKNALEKGDVEDAKACYGYLVKAMNSYLTLMNRQITSKVGDPFGYL